MAQTFQAYMADALTEAGFTDAEVITTLGKLYSHEKLSSKLNAIVKTATEDYTAEVGRVKQLREKDTKREAELAKYYTDTNAAYQQALNELNEARTSGRPADFDPTKYTSKADLKAVVDDLGQRWSSVLKDATTIATQHAVRFQEALDLEAVEKIATEQRIPIQAAYKAYIEPRVAEEKKKADEKWRETTRAEIEKNVRSEHHLPVDPRPQETAPIYARHDSKSAPANLDQELMDAWHGVGATK